MNIINRPTLVIDEEKIRSNILYMRDKAKAHSLLFRPHFKTHQSAAIANIFKDLGIQRATVSSLPMALYFYRHGWKDLTVAIPHNPRETHLLEAFSKESAPALLLDHPDTVAHLHQQLHQSISVWIKIDTGYQRCGIPWNQEHLLVTLTKQIRMSPKLHLSGILTHAGHSYFSQNKHGIDIVQNLQIERMHIARDIIVSSGSEPLQVSIGDTPCCRLADDFEGIDEIRPGNFVFYDVDQLYRSVCTWDEIAMILACPIIGIYPARNQLAIHGGAVHLSKEFRTPTNDMPCYGLPVILEPNGWSSPLDAKLVSLSQEHGIVTFNAPLDKSLKVGGLLGILPIHSCLTADLFHSYTSTKGSRFSKRRSADWTSNP